MATFKSVDILAQPDSARIHIAQAATTQTDSGSDIGRVSKIERPGVLLNVDNNKINKYHLLHPVSLQTDVFFQIQDV